MKETFDGLLSDLYEAGNINNIDKYEYEELIRLFIKESSHLIPLQNLEPEIIYSISDWMEYQRFNDSYEYMEKMKDLIVKKYKPIIENEIENFKNYMEKLEVLESNNRDREIEWFNRQRI